MTRPRLFSGSSHAADRLRWLSPAILLLALVGCFGSAQIGADPDCFKAVDALYTAVLSRSDPLLNRAEADLRTLRESGKLPAAADAELQDIISTARTGKWRDAAEDLDSFMRAQRRPKLNRTLVH